MTVPSRHHEGLDYLGDATPREAARRRLTARRDLGSNAVAYLFVNAALVVIWALSGGYFWPGWVLGLWGVGLALHAWEAFVRRPITEADIDAEVERLSR